MKRHLIYAVVAAVIGSSGFQCAAAAAPDEKDYDESVRKPVRRLYPQRDFDKLMKEKHKEIQEREQAQEEESKDSKKKVPERKVVARKQQTVPPRPAADKSLMNELLSKDYSIKKIEPLYEEPKPIKWKDDPIPDDVQGLLQHVTAARKGGATLYTPKGVSTANDANGVFFTFESDGTRATSRLHLRVQYYADDPLNYSDIVFTIDGFNYSFHPSRPARGKMGARMYWENSEDALVAEHKDLVYALSHCHWARMSLKGADGMDHVKMLTNEQIEAFACTLDLFRAMGGKL